MRQVLTQRQCSCGIRVMQPNRQAGRGTTAMQAMEWGAGGVGVLFGLSRSWLGRTQLKPAEARPAGAAEEESSGNRNC